MKILLAVDGSAYSKKMLAYLSTHESLLTPNNSYTVFTGTSSSGLSQNLISVSAVPEADTWAMMLVGLGMVGFMGRRKSEKSAKFDA